MAEHAAARAVVDDAAFFAPTSAAAAAGAIRSQEPRDLKGGLERRSVSPEVVQCAFQPKIGLEAGSAEPTSRDLGLRLGVQVRVRGVGFEVRILIRVRLQG